MQIKRNGLIMARKTKAIPKRAAIRKKLPISDYVFPEERSFPIPDAYHGGLALQALLRIAGRHGVDPELRAKAAKVLGAVKKKFPGIYKGEHNLVSSVKRQYHLNSGKQTNCSQSIVDRMFAKYNP